MHTFVYFAALKYSVSNNTCQNMFHVEPIKGPFKNAYVFKEPLKVLLSVCAVLAVNNY